jgi:hypothetical protein
MPDTLIPDVVGLCERLGTYAADDVSYALVLLANAQEGLDREREAQLRRAGFWPQPVDDAAHILAMLADAMEEAGWPIHCHKEEARVVWPTFRWGWWPDSQPPPLGGASLPENLWLELYEGAGYSWSGRSDGFLWWSTREGAYLALARVLAG